MMELSQVVVVLVEERGWQLYRISRWTKKTGKVKHHLEIEFEEKKHHEIYWDDVAMFVTHRI